MKLDTNQLVGGGGEKEGVPLCDGKVPCCLKKWGKIIFFKCRILLLLKKGIIFLVEDRFLGWCKGVAEICSERGRSE